MLKYIRRLPALLLDLFEHLMHPVGVSAFDQTGDRDHFVLDAPKILHVEGQSQPFLDQEDHRTRR